MPDLPGRAKRLEDQADAQTLAPASRQSLYLFGALWFYVFVYRETLAGMSGLIDRVVADNWTIIRHFACEKKHIQTRP